jgi:hypothetical protein
VNQMIRALGLALAVIALLSGTVAAGHLSAGVKSYTGCLVSKDGVIIKIKEGEAPSSPCSGGMNQVHFSGGDITKITVEGALQGGGDNGEVTISLKPEFTLPAGCLAGRVAEWNGSAWVCGVDNDTTYLAGTGLDLTGTTFSIDEAYRVKNTPDCSSGQFATGFDNAGAITCAAPPSALPEVWFQSTSHADAPQGHENEVFARFLLAGNYLVNIAGTAGDDSDGNDEVDVTCYLYAGESLIRSFGGSAEGSGVLVGISAEATLALTHVAKLSATTELRITCRSDTGSDNVAISMTILKVGTVN